MRELLSVLFVMQLCMTGFINAQQIVRGTVKYQAIIPLILGYTCMLAETELDGKEIIAWFTADIPIPVGPVRYCGLPGLILEVNVSHGEIVWIATDIDLNPPGGDLPGEPGVGKKINPERYKKIQEEKMAEWEKGQMMKRFGPEQHFPNSDGSGKETFAGCNRGST